MAGKTGKVRTQAGQGEVRKSCKPVERHSALSTGDPNISVTATSCLQANACSALPGSAFLLKREVYGSPSGD